MNKRNANRLIESAGIALTLGKFLPKPTAESHVRPLAGLEPEEQHEALEASEVPARRQKT